MVNIMMGPEGSGKTKQLIGALNQAVQRESGSIVCIEKGDIPGAEGISAAPFLYRV